MTRNLTLQEMDQSIQATFEMIRQSEKTRADLEATLDEHYPLQGIMRRLDRIEKLLRDSQ